MIEGQARDAAGEEFEGDYDDQDEPHDIQCPKCFGIGEVETENEASHIEMFFIAFFKSNICRYGPNFGYNLTDGGEGLSGHKHTDEAKKKMEGAISKFLEAEEAPFFLKR